MTEAEESALVKIATPLLAEQVRLMRQATADMNLGRLNAAGERRAQIFATRMIGLQLMKNHNLTKDDATKVLIKTSLVSSELVLEAAQKGFSFGASAK